MNDYTLSPAFNTRGIKELKADTRFEAYNLLTIDDMNITEDYLLEKVLDNNPENSKGVIKINNKGDGAKSVLNGADPIRPIGLQFNFTGDVISSLSNYTRGAFIVRQKRIPTLLAQGVSIGTSNKAYYPMIKSGTYLAESFLTVDDGFPRLQRSFFEVSDPYVTNNALLCPEATLRPYIFNNFFNSSEFTLKKPKFGAHTVFVDKEGTEQVFTLDTPVTRAKDDIDALQSLSTNLLLVEPGIELINNGEVKFSSRIGNALEAWTHTDPIKGDLNDLYNDMVYSETQWSNDVTKVRGEFNTYVGSSKELDFGDYYNIFQKNYSFEKN